MPAKSSKQYRLMQAVAHGAEPKVKDGPSEGVAREIVEKTPPKKRAAFAGRGFGSRVLRD
jgi:hypothetical protein